MNNKSHAKNKDISGMIKVKLSDDNDFRKVAIADDDITIVIRRSIKNVIYALQKSVLSGALFVFLLSNHHHHHHALAASGGRMGGSSFSSSSRSSSSGSSSSGSSYSGSSYSGSSSSFFDSSSSSAHRPSSSSYNSSTQTSSPDRPMTESEARAARQLLCAIIGVFLVIHIWVFYNKLKNKEASKKSILMLQVGLLGTAISLQKDLNQIASLADTSTPKGFRYILQEATLALLRHPNYCVSGYSSVVVKWSVSDTEKLFNKLSIDERGKFDEETLVNVNNVRKKSATTEKTEMLSNECIVVTIIAAAIGVHKLPPVKSNEQLKEALQKLASIPSENILAAEVLWTPQEENDILTKQQVLEDYPLLHSF
ncbi:FLUCTUATING-LIGHT-ACCLIMATION protein 1, chloroplastic-like [Rutidosis leptorrhynchoides]|uniref:FLUCTUATING-LIGHT-ACCLIMATION protein 1, chloroplastic-like n=1 Tax=Rutidosis leptorrhynchoides TaxID=125765 RepID=UPI003A99FEC2